MRVILAVNEKELGFENRISSYAEGLGTKQYIPINFPHVYDSLTRLMFNTYSNSPCKPLNH